MNLIEPINLRPDATISDAFGLLRGNYGMVVCVTDSDGLLLGIVSDGDLRTVLLQGLSIEEKLTSVMNKNPVTIEEDSLQDVIDIGSLISALEKNGIPLEDVLGSTIAIPVVDSQNRVVGLTNLNMLRYSEGISHNNSGRAPHVLVVGGAGYIGSMLTELLCDIPSEYRSMFKFVKPTTRF
jgi:CBS domain-containing protein